jgi:hypothetical protein
MFSVDDVKETLPPVQVQFKDGTVVLGRVTGRRNFYASVSGNVHGSFFVWTFSWETVTNCVNTNATLKG